MITLAFLICFLGFFACYATSKNATLPTLRLGEWLQEKPVLSNVVGMFLMVNSCILLVLILGLGSGILTFFIMLMTIGSLVIILVPLKVIGYKGLTFLFLLFLVFELIKF